MPAKPETTPADASVRQPKVEVKDGYLVISLPIVSPAYPSTSGKTHIVASTSGNLRTTVSLEGMPVTVTASAFIKKAVPAAT